MAAAHYFDDTFSRQRRASLGPRRPTGFARSVTRTRSIGQRSDWGSTNGENTENGDNDDDAEEDDPAANGKPERSWSIYNEDDPNTGKPRPEDDPDDPINKYVQDQLARIKSHESADLAEELAAQNDGAHDDL